MLRPNWRECPRGDMTGPWSSLYVTLNRRGYITLTRKTFERIGGPKAVLLLYDSANNRIGLRPTNPGAKNAYPVAKHGSHGGKLIRAYRMLGEFGIVVPETIQFPDAEVDQDGILILDMRTARVSKRSIAHRKRKAASAAPVTVRNS